LAGWTVGQGRRAILLEAGELAVRRD
jgi:hypothetical protein